MFPAKIIPDGFRKDTVISGAAPRQDETELLHPSCKSVVFHVVHLAEYFLNHRLDNPRIPGIRIITFRGDVLHKLTSDQFKAMGDRANRRD